jgi:hypothetical protein
VRKLAAVEGITLLKKDQMAETNKRSSPEQDDINASISAFFHDPEIVYTDPGKRKVVCIGLTEKNERSGYTS